MIPLFLGQARFLGWNVAPFLDHRLLHLSGVLSGSGANFLGNVHALFARLQVRHKFSDEFAGLLRLKVASFFGDLLDNGLLPIKAFFGTRFGDTSAGTTELTRFLFTVGLRSGFLHGDLVGGTHLFGPLGTFLGGGVAIGDILAFLLVFSFTVNNVVLDFVNVIPERLEFKF